MGCPNRGRGTFGAMREMQTGSPSSHERPWKHGVGVASFARFLFGRLSLQVVPQCKYYQALSKPNARQEVREAQEKVGEEVKNQVIR